MDLRHLVIKLLQIIFGSYGKNLVITFLLEIFPTLSIFFPQSTVNASVLLTLHRLRNIVYNEEVALVLLSVRDMQSLQEKPLTDFSFRVANPVSQSIFTKRDKDTLLHAIVFSTTQLFPLEAAGK
jgi:hypothetical protein